MVVSRRRFIKRGSLLIFAVGASLSSADSIFGRDTNFVHPSPTQEDLPPTFNEPELFFKKATFAPYVNTVFRMYSNSSKLLITTLVKISDIGPVPDKKSDRECFMLEFRGSEPLRQNTYRIEHNVLGRFELFLVPAGNKKKSFYYQAVINRLNG